MAKNWDYAELVKAAKGAGGPGFYVEQIAQASRISGRLEMLPWIVGTVAAAIVVTGVAVVGYIKAKDEAVRNEILLAEKEIINGINEYDTTHSSEEGGDKNADVSEL